MKNFLIVIILLMCFFFSKAFSQSYVPFEQGSVIRFTVVNHMIFKSTVAGTFKDIKGTIIFAPQNLAASSIDVSVAVKTINTGIGMRDNDLLKEKYFNEQKYPFITIKSQNIIRGSSNGQYILNGSLIMKGITKNISFPFTAELRKDSYFFKGSFDINRIDYNVGPDNSIDKQVSVDLLVTAK